MRIGIFIGKLIDAKTGGASTFQTSLLEEIINTKSRHQFFIFHIGENKSFQDHDQIKFIQIKPVKKLFSCKKSAYHKFDSNQKILENKIELVWFLTPEYHFVEAPFVLTIWDLQHRLQSYFPEVSLSGSIFEEREKFHQDVVAKASYIITGNRQGASEVNQFYNLPLARIKTIPLPTPQFTGGANDGGQILQKNNLSKNKYLFYPAQFWPHKNHIRLIKALAILKKEGLDLKLAFTGSDKGNEKYIKSKALEYGLKEEVKFLGFVSKEELVTLYQNAACMTFASLFGPDNIPPLEAMSIDCPVICADSLGMKDQLEDAALFFNRLDENDLAQKVKILLKDENLKNDLITKGRVIAEAASTKNYIRKFLELVDEFEPIRECWSSDEKFVHL